LEFDWCRLRTVFEAPGSLTGAEEATLRLRLGEVKMLLRGTAKGGLGISGCSQNGGRRWDGSCSGEEKNGFSKSP
jgi:hypothetical protein